MNNFFTDRFNISKINFCMLVDPNDCKLLHKNRSSHGLVIMLNGINKYVFSDGSEMTVKEGELFYLPKFSSYRLIQVKKGECIAVNFELAEGDATYPHFFLTSKYKIKYTTILKELLSAWSAHTQVSENICMLKLYELVCAIQADASKQYVNSKKRNIAIYGAEYIINNISRAELTVDEISKKLNLSPEYFRKIFASVYGTSPKKYMLELRIQRAKELMLSNDMTVSKISMLCGYENESYFCREFKRITGHTPTEYIKGFLC